MNAAFNCMIALDNAYDDLLQGQIKACEEVVEKQTEKMTRNSRYWPKAWLATYGTWDIYREISARNREPNRSCSVGP